MGPGVSRCQRNYIHGGGGGLPYKSLSIIWLLIRIGLLMLFCLQFIFLISLLNAISFLTLYIYVHAEFNPKYATTC